MVVSPSLKNKIKKLISIAEIHKLIFGIPKVDYWDINNQFM
jgi:hypothetical protein